MENAVEQFATLPGIGRKTALRFVLHLLRQNPEDVKKFTDSITALKTEIQECKHCHNIADSDTCEICSDSRRDTSTICVVENVKDILSIEATGQYKGLYHVLGGIISPMEGIGPSDLHINSLIERVNSTTIREVIFALRATIEGDTTGYYIYKKLPRQSEIIVSTLAKGIAIGNDLEYTDELTLGRSIVNRVKFNL
ncbi:MAG: recombination mediator RecR [Marinifilaceae bacterium]|nr:recombination mediator RecR [Marinifilaceae bacterium]